MPPRTLSSTSWVSPFSSRSRSLSASALSVHAAAAITPSPHVGEKNKFEAPTEESLQVRIERLGRERSTTFTTLWSEISFVFSITMSQFLTEYFVSGFTVILPTLIRELDIPQASSVWPATAFSLVIASTLLVFGRLGDMWGGYAVFLGGLVWLLTWSIIAGLSINSLMLVFCRALQGVGAAAFLPAGVMLMGSLYRPGPRKNLVFAIYGTFSSLRFLWGYSCAGVFISGSAVSLQLSR